MRRVLLLIIGIMLSAAFIHSAWAQLLPYNAEEAEVAAPGAALNFPTDLAFTPDGSKAFVSEKNTGNVRVLIRQADGRYQLQAQPFINRIAVSLLPRAYHERGLTSVAVDSFYPDNPYIYTYYTREPSPRVYKLRITRWEDVGGVGRNPVVLRDYDLLDNTYRHVASKIRHSPFDGMLYIAIGDNNRPDTAQVLSDPHAKVHRINPYDGSNPPDNPFPGSSVYAYGLRHTFGICIHPDTGDLYGVDNGENCDDRALKILPGQNYGWGLPPTPGCPFSQSVIWRSGTAFGNQVAPAGCTFLASDSYSSIGFFYGDLLFGEWNTRNISRIALTGADLDQGTRDMFFRGSFETGRITAVEQAPDGLIYFVGCVVDAQFPSGCQRGFFSALVVR